MSAVRAPRAPGRALAALVVALAAALFVNASLAATVFLPSPPNFSPFLAGIVVFELVELVLWSVGGALAWITRLGPGASFGGTAGLLVLERVLTLGLGVLLILLSGVPLLGLFVLVALAIVAPTPRLLVIDAFVVAFGALGVLTGRSGLGRVGALLTLGCGLLLVAFDLAGFYFLYSFLNMRIPMHC